LRSNDTSAEIFVLQLDGKLQPPSVITIHTLDAPFGLPLTPTAPLGIVLVRAIHKPHPVHVFPDEGRVPIASLTVFATHDIGLISRVMVSKYTTPIHTASFATLFPSTSAFPKSVA